MKARVVTLAAIVLCCHAAEPDKTVLVLGARAGDAERIGARGAEAYRARGRRIVNPALLRTHAPGRLLCGRRRAGSGERRTAVPTRTSLRLQAAAGPAAGGDGDRRAC